MGARFVLALALAACGDAATPHPAVAAAEPYTDSPLVGRWIGADRTLEFVADGALIQYVPYTGEQRRRNADGTWRSELVPGFRCAMGRFAPVGRGRVAWELTRVGGLDFGEGTWTWRFDGDTLSLAGEGGEPEVLTRDATPVPAAARPLVGLWRRTGSLMDHQDMGVRFTPGGLSIVVGKNAQWDNSSGGGSVSWLCLAATYTVNGGVLEEASPQYRDRPRARPFTLEGDRLSFGPARVYERVHGLTPLRSGRLDVAAWKAMK